MRNIFNGLYYFTQNNSQMSSIWTNPKLTTLGTQTVIKPQFHYCNMCNYICLTEQTGKQCQQWPTVSHCRWLELARLMTLVKKEQNSFTLHCMTQPPKHITSEGNSKTGHFVPLHFVTFCHPATCLTGELSTHFPWVECTCYSLENMVLEVYYSA
jgi:hypothetical protein